MKVHELERHMALFDKGMAYYRCRKCHRRLLLYYEEEAETLPRKDAECPTGRKLGMWERVAGWLVDQYDCRAKE